jgi:hypothetical protein
MSSKNKPTYGEGLEALLMVIAVAIAYFLLIVY